MDFVLTKNAQAIVRPIPGVAYKQAMLNSATKEMYCPIAIGPNMSL